MKSYHHKILTVKISLFLVFLLALSSNPFIFERIPWVNSQLRGILGLACIFFLFLSSKRIVKTDLLIYFLTLCNFAVEFSWKSKVNNVLSYLSVILLFLLLFRALQLSKLYRLIFFRMWIQVAFLVSSSMIVLFFLGQFTSLDTDFFDFDSIMGMQEQATNPNYKFHMFGIILRKVYSSFNLTRTFGYFVEPQYAGFYFTMNLLLAHYSGKFKNKKNWVFLNLFAGIFTFSTTFFLALFFIFILHYADFRFRFNLYALGLVAIPIFIIGYEIVRTFSFLDLTSFGDRENRIFNAIEVTLKASYQDLFFGHGVSYQGDSGRGFSAGFFLALIERGISGLFFVLTLLVYVLRKNFEVVLIFLLYLLAIPLYVNNLFWLSTLILWTGSQLRKEVEA